MAIVVGTAGHIDHGKTTLVKALTGVDCDRLEEEKKRGITIELGFAGLHINENTSIGIVDVPGHEKFVKNMVAGASGIDAVMLIISADEGVMPQTREHLEICNILGIKQGIVVLTKIDSVDEEMQELAKEEIQEFLLGSCLENSPLFLVSSLNGIGIEELKQYLIKLNKELTQDNKTSLFRLSVDRVFTMKGHGTVITGTSISGKARLNDELAIYPKNQIVTRIRAIQSHGKSVEEIEAGKRISINLANCSLEDIERGDLLASPNSFFPVDKWIVKLSCLKSAPQGIIHRKEVHVHHGAREFLARVYLFDRQILEQGESCLAEIRISPKNRQENFVEFPLVGAFNDHCVLRSSSPLRTIAGASVLMPLEYSFTRKDFTEELQEKFLSLEDYFYNNPQKLILTHLELSEQMGRNFNELLVLTSLNAKQLEKYLTALSSFGEILCYNKELKSYITKEIYTDLENKILKTLEEYHKKEPLKQGILKNILLDSKEIKLNTAEQQKLGLFILERLQKSQKILYTNEVYFLPNFKVKLEVNEQEIEDKILKALQENLQTPPNIKELLESINIDQKEAQPILKLLVENKKITKLTENMYYDTETLNIIKEKTLKHFETNETLDPTMFKEITNGLSRKYIIAMLEYFDKEKITLRVGDIRKLRKTT